jgi:hypothetical protein
MPVNYVIWNVESTRVGDRVFGELILTFVK